MVALELDFSYSEILLKALVQIFSLFDSSTTNRADLQTIGGLLRFPVAESFYSPNFLSGNLTFYRRNRTKRQEKIRTKTMMNSMYIDDSAMRVTTSISSTISLSLKLTLRAFKYLPKETEIIKPKKIAQLFTVLDFPRLIKTFPLSEIFPYSFS